VASPIAHRRRLVWLLVCVAAGVAVGGVGQLMAGSQAWWLAVPAAVALGWLLVADPEACEPPRREPPDR
jgi:hypothetical protein